MNRESDKNGFNLYKNNQFWLVIKLGTNEKEAIEAIKHYIKVNNFNIEEFQYSQFIDNIRVSEIKNIPNE